MDYTADEERLLFDSYMHHRKIAIDRVMSEFSKSGIESCVGLIMLFVESVSHELRHGRIIREDDLFGMWSYYRHLHNNEARACDKLKQIEFDPSNWEDFAGYLIKGANSLNTLKAEFFG